MEFTHLTDIQLVQLHYDLKTLHTGAADKTFFVGDAARPNNTANAIFLKDDRLSDMLWKLELETYNELCKRFAKPLDIEKFELVER